MEIEIPGADKMKKLGHWLRKESVAGYVFVLPFIIGFLSFTLIPTIYSIWLSLTRYNILSAPVFVGVDNFIRMFTKDPLLWKSFFNTFRFAIISVPLKLTAALIVAMLFYKTSKASAVYRAVYYLPSILGGSIAVAILWRRLFATDGAFNAILSTIGIESKIGWLGRPETAMGTLIVLSVWQFGSSMLIFLAGLKQIPTSLYEAASVDGCPKVKQFFKITIPMLTPVIFFNLIQQTINGFMAFTSSFVITQGKPLNTTLFYAVYMYQRSFEFKELGYGSAMAWFMLFVIAILTAFIFKSSSKWVFNMSEEG